MTELKHFRFWCEKVLPLVYDDSLSYYEVVCKCVDYINRLIDSDKEILADVNQLKNELAVVQKWIGDYDTSFANDIIEKYIATSIFFGLTSDGYFVAYIPKSWNNIEFRTTGYDVEVTCCNDCKMDYGHLVLFY